jgi:hypothetical protein
VFRQDVAKTGFRAGVIIGITDRGTYDLADNVDVVLFITRTRTATALHFLKK